MEGVMETPTGKISEGFLHPNLVVFSESEATDKNSLLSGGRNLKETEITRQETAAGGPNFSNAVPSPKNKTIGPNSPKRKNLPKSASSNDLASRKSSKKKNIKNVEVTIRMR